MRTALLTFLFCSLSFAQVFPAGNRAITPQDIGVVTDGLSTTLTAPIGPQDGVISVVNGSAFQPFNIITFPATGEKSMICSSTSISLTVCPGGRGFDDTVPVGHATLEVVSVLINSTYFKLRDQELLSMEAAFFATGTDVTVSNGMLQMTFNPLSATNPGQQARSVNSKLAEIPSATDFTGVVCDGVTDNAAALQAMATNAANSTVLIPKGVCAISTDTTLPASISLSFQLGGMLAPAQGATLTISGPITSAPSAQIFFGDGAVILANPGRSVNPLWFPGEDIGAQINAAYAACGTSANSCILELPPNGNYNYSTTIQVPASIYSELDAHGSVLNWVGSSGDALVVGPGGTPPYVSGKISNLYLNGPTGVATSGIHVISRIGFVFEGLRVKNFNGAGSYCIGYENQGGQFNEQNTIKKADLYNCTKSLRLWVTDGTNSFGYNNFTDIHFGLFDGQYGFSAEGTGSTQSAFVTGGFYEMRVNANTAIAARFINLQAGAVWAGSTVNLTGEHTTGVAVDYGIYEDTASTMYVQGNYGVNGMTTHPGFSPGALVIHPTYNINGAIHFEPTQGVAQQRHCKYDLGPTNATFWLASYAGVENNCGFQVVSRNTDNTNLDVDVQGSGSAPVNILSADPLSKNVGIGPGYSPGAPATHQLEVNGTLSVAQDMTVGTAAHVIGVAPNNDTNFQLSLGIGATTVVKTFAKVWNSPPNCVASPNQLITEPGGWASWALNPTTATLTIAVPAAQGVVVTFFVHCEGNAN